MKGVKLLAGKENATSTLTVRSVPNNLLSRLSGTRIMSKDMKTMNKLMIYILEGIVPYLPDEMSSDIPFEEVFLQQIMKCKSLNMEKTLPTGKTTPMAKNETECGDKIVHEIVHEINAMEMHGYVPSVSDKQSYEVIDSTTTHDEKEVKKPEPEPEQIPEPLQEQNTKEKSIVDDMEIPEY